MALHSRAGAGRGDEALSTPEVRSVLDFAAPPPTKRLTCLTLVSVLLLAPVYPEARVILCPSSVQNAPGASSHSGEKPKASLCPARHYRMWPPFPAHPTHLASLGLPCSAPASSSLFLPRHVLPQDICTSSALCLECSFPRPALGSLLYLLQLFACLSSPPQPPPPKSYCLSAPDTSYPASWLHFFLCVIDRALIIYCNVCFPHLNAKFQGKGEGFLSFSFIAGSPLSKSEPKHMGSENDLRSECQGGRTPGEPFGSAAASPLGPHWCDPQNAQAPFRHDASQARPLRSPVSLSCLSPLPLLFHIHFLSLFHSFPLFGA